MDLIKNQNITKRRKTSFGHTNKSAETGAGFMGHFNQNLAKKNKEYQTGNLRAGRYAKRTRYDEGLFSLIKKKLAGKNIQMQKKPQYRSYEKNKHKSEPSGGFGFRIPSLATLAVVAGTVIIALAVLKWDNFNIELPEFNAFEPNSVFNIDQHTLRYAATGISGLTPFQSQIKLPSDTVLNNIVIGIETQSAVMAQNLDENTPHDLLITFQWQDYRVKRGDTVSGIAQKFGVSVGAIIASNDIRNARRLQEGINLRIPNIDGIPYSVKAGDNLSGIAVSFNVPLEVILDVNDIKSDSITAGETIFIPGARMNDMDLRRSLGDLFIYPVQSRHITSRFGMRRDPFNGNMVHHNGIDIRVPIGTTVTAAMDGVISMIGETWLYGKYIIMSHPNGYKTLYAHLNSTSVRQGDRVLQGRKIGESGNTGRSTGPHLHFSIFNHHGRDINPLDILR